MTLDGRDGLRLIVRTAVAVGVVICCFIIATPRSGGPDEPSHMVQSAALLRGQFDGVPSPDEPGVALVRVPAMVGDPNPGCWALQPFVPASCAVFQPDRTNDVLAGTTATNYPPWTYVLPGLASFIPAPDIYTYLARALMAAIPFTLVVASLVTARRLSRGTAAAVLLGMTPIAWFSMSIVNPSAVAIAGGLALWISLLARPRTDALLIAGWAALLLSRRDGPLWATLVVIAVCALLSIRPLELWRGRSVRARWILAAIVPIPAITALLNGLYDLNLVLALAPSGLVALDALLGLATRLERPAHRVILAALCASALGVVVLVGIGTSPNGLSAETTQLVMSNTGEHLRQLVGVLGWLDAPVPTFAVYLFWAAVGGLATVALLEQRRVALVGLGVIVTTVVVAWILELGQGSDYGQYWQGRYSMPFAIGLCLLLSVRADQHLPTRPLPSPQIDRLAPTIGVVGWLILNAGFVAAMQRWGVGLAGSWRPWDWSTYGTPVPPWILLIVCAVASAWLVSLMTADARGKRSHILFSQRARRPAE